MLSYNYKLYITTYIYIHILTHPPPTTPLVTSFDHICIFIYIYISNLTELNHSRFINVTIMGFAMGKSKNQMGIQWDDTSNFQHDTFVSENGLCRTLES